MQSPKVKLNRDALSNEDTNYASNLQRMFAVPPLTPIAIRKLQSSYKFEQYTNNQMSESELEHTEPVVKKRRQRRESEPYVPVDKRGRHSEHKWTEEEKRRFHEAIKELDSWEAVEK